MTGIAAALAEVASGPLSAPADAGQQADLWDDGEGVGAGPLDDPLKHLGTDLFQRPRRGGGRPKGSQNRSTEAWRNFFLAQRRDPALVLGDIYSMSVEELASRLGCDMVDALKVQLRAAEILMPYLHAKQPLAIKAEGNLPTLHLHMPYVPASASAAANDGGVLDLFATEMQQNQGLGPLSAGPVGMQQLVGSENIEQDQCVTGSTQGIKHPAANAPHGPAVASDLPRNPPPGRDPGLPPPIDGPPVSPLSDQQVYKV